VVNNAFFGLETEETVNTGLGFGAKKGNWLIKKLLADYKNKSFINSDGEMDLTPCPIINSRIFKKYGFKLNGESEVENGIAIYSKDYFNPLDDATGKLNMTSNTHSIHWYMKTWVPFHMIVRSKFTKPFHRLFGVDCFKKIKNFFKR
jgi:hypothetical protein